MDRGALREMAVLGGLPLKGIQQDLLCAWAIVVSLHAHCVNCSGFKGAWNKCSQVAWCWLRSTRRWTELVSTANATGSTE